MKTVALVLLFSLVAATARAQITTLEWQGGPITGSSATLLGGATGPPGDLPLTSSPFVGQITGTLTVSGQPNGDNLALVSFDFELQGSYGADIGLYPGPLPLTNFLTPGPNELCGDGCIYLTVLNNSFVGATLDLSGDDYHEPQEYFGLDSVSYLYAGTNGTCQSAGPENGNPDGSVTYEGPTIHNCIIDAGGSGGHWTVKAPELDETSTLSALTLLLGSLAVLRGRRGMARS
jgi:hypothetical protein